MLQFSNRTSSKSLIKKCALHLSVVVLSMAIPTQVLQAQQITVTGMIRESNGNGIPGVCVVMKGTTIGTFSSLDGKYSITVPYLSVLEFSLKGYSTQGVVVRNQREISVTMTIKEINSDKQTRKKREKRKRVL